MNTIHTRRDITSIIYYYDTSLQHLAMSSDATLPLYLSTNISDLNDKSDVDTSEIIRNMNRLSILLLVLPPILLLLLLLL